MHLEVLHVEAYPSPEVHALHLIAAAIIYNAEVTKKGFERMANDFTALTTAIDKVGTEIAEVVSILQNPVVDNNDQATIDALTAKLSAAADSLGGALPVTPAPTPAPVADGSGGTVAPAPADGTGSPDVTP